MMDIGFIGLGTMGSLMAENLIKAGNQVRVWNRSRVAVLAKVSMRRGGAEESSGVKPITRGRLDAPPAKGERRV